MPMHSRQAIVIAIFITLVSGCATQHIALDDSYQHREQSVLDGLDCQFILGNISDDRKDRDSLGRLGNSFVNDEPGTGVDVGDTTVDAGVTEHAQFPGPGPEDKIINGSVTDSINHSQTLEWLINGLNSAGFHNAPDPGQGKIVRVNINLKLAYIQHSLSSKASNIVMNVAFDDDASAYIVRGSSANVNWGNTAGEIRSSFNRSLGQAIEKLNSLAIQRCGEKGQG